MSAPPNHAISGIFDRLYFCFILFLPLVYVSSIIDPVLIPRQIYLSAFVLILALTLAYHLKNEKLKPDFSFLKLPVFAAYAVLLLMVLVSFAQAIAISESIYVLSKYSIEAVFFVLTTYLLITEKLNFLTLAKAIILFVFITEIVAIVQVLKYSQKEGGLFNQLHEITSTNGNKNLLSSILFIGLPFLLASAQLPKVWKTLSVILIGVALVLVWIIQTRAVMLAFIVFFVVNFGLSMLLQKNNSSKISARTLLLVASLLLASFSIFAVLNKDKFSRLFNVTSLVERMALYQNSLEMIREHYVLGVGAGNWQVSYLKYGLNHFPIKEVRDGLTTFQRPHNDFLWVFSETGMAGFAAYVALFAIIIFYTVRLIQKTKSQPERSVYMTILATLLGYLFIAVFDFPLERIEHQVLLTLLFAIVTAGYYKHCMASQQRDTTSLSISTLQIGILLPVLFSFFVGINRCRGEYHSHKLIAAHQKANWKVMIKEADKAVNECYSMNPMSIPVLWYKGVALFSLGNIPEAQANFEIAYSLSPYNIHVLNNLASCYETLGDHQKAIAFYQKALTVSAGMEESLLNLSAVYFNIKHYKLAFETINRCDTSCTDPKYKTFLPAIVRARKNELSGTKQ